MDEADAIPTEGAATIEVRRAACGEIFQAEEESAGKAESCPACGALNDVAVQEDPVLDPQATEELSSHVENSRRGGVPGWFWWFLVGSAAIGFIIAIRFLFANTWEQNHLSELVDRNDKAEHSMDSGDFEEATRQYEIISGELENRRLESRYLGELLKTAQYQLPAARRDATIAARVHDADNAAAAGKWQIAIMDYRQAIAMAPKLLDSSDPIAPVLDHAGKGLAAAHDSLTGVIRPAIASTQKVMDGQTLAAINRFQRAGEAFSALVSGKSFLFVDGQGKWRRRQYIVWNVATETQLEDGSPGTKIQLEYAESSRITGPHEQAKEALADGNFIVSETSDFDHLQTRFVLEAGKWVAAQRRRSDGQTWVDARDRQFAEKQASNRFSLQDLWNLEDQAFGQ